MESSVTLQKVCKALSDETRLRITRCLVESDLCVCELADALDLPQSTLSNHLAKLRALGIVDTRRVGTWVYYHIAPDTQENIARLFEAFAHDNERTAIDRDRLEKRLDMRINGQCARSYGQL
jgi:ArsR family transcriptional regulator